GVGLGAAADRALGEGERELRRVDVAVGRQVRGPRAALGRDRWEETLRLVRRHELERKPERLRPARLTRELLHPLPGRGEPEGPDLAPAGFEAHLGAERAIELYGAHHHLRQAER